VNEVTKKLALQSTSRGLRPGAVHVNPDKNEAYMRFQKCPDSYGQDVTFHSTPTITVLLQALFTASEATLTFVDLLLLAEEINNSQIVCCSLRFQPWFELWKKWPRDFFVERCKKTVARTRFWLAAYITSYHCFILSIHWFRATTKEFKYKFHSCIELQVEIMELYTELSFWKLT